MSDELSLVTKVSIDGKGFQTGIREIQAGATHLAEHLKNHLGQVFAVAAIEEFARKTIEMGRQIADTSSRLGISTDAVQQFSFAAKQTGSDIEAVANGLDKMAKAQIAAIRGNASMTDAFGRFRVTSEMLRNESPEEIFRRIGEAMEGLPASAQLTADALEIFGKAGSKLIPTLKELKDKSAEAKESGLIISKGDIKDLEEAGEAAEKLWLKIKVLGSKVVIGASYFTKLPTKLGDLWASEEDDLNRPDSKASKNLARLQGINAKKGKDKITRQELDEMASEQADEYVKLLKKVHEVEEQTADISERAAFKKLTSEQQIKQIMEERLKLSARLADSEASGETDADSLLSRANLRHKLAQLSETAAGLGRGAGLKTPTDSLTRVGNFLGTSGAPNVIENIQRKQLDTQEAILGMMRFMFNPGGGLSQITPK